MALNNSQRNLLKQLQDLKYALRRNTFEKFKRVNPFYEDMADWNEKGSFWSQKENITIYDSTTIVGDVCIGEKTWVGPFVSLDGTGGLHIGKHCSISAGCQLLSHDTVMWALSGGKEDYSYAPTKIGNNCFLGTNAIVLKCVSIGDYSVVAAGSVVTKSFPSYSIVGGVPARLIGSVVFDENSGQISLIYTSSEKPK